MYSFLIGPRILKRTYAKGEALSQDEIDYIQWGIDQHRRDCPDCREGFLICGPVGGCSVNVQCSYCTSEFNLTSFAGELVMAERISHTKSGRRTGFRRRYQDS